MYLLLFPAIGVEPVRHLARSEGHVDLIRHSDDLLSAERAIHSAPPKMKVTGLVMVGRF